MSMKVFLGLCFLDLSRKDLLSWNKMLNICASRFCIFSFSFFSVSNETALSVPTHRTRKADRHVH